ncbi:MAG: hypothetical protein RR276_02360 [Angelakisella sp.]
MMNFCRMTGLYLVNLLRCGTVRTAGLFLACFVLLFGALPQADSEDTIGLVRSPGGGTAAAQQLAHQLETQLEQLPGYRVRCYLNSAALTRAVVREEISCGFALAADAGEKLQNGTTKGLLEGYYPRGSAVAALINEAVGAAVTRVTAPLAAARYLEQAKLPFPVPPQTAQQYVTEYTAQMLAQGSLLKVELTVIGGSPAPARDQMLRLALAAFAGGFLIFAVLLGADGPETGSFALRCSGVSVLGRMLPLLGGWFVLSTAGALAAGLLLGAQPLGALRGSLLLGAAGALVALAGWQLRRYRVLLVAVSPVAAGLTVLCSGGIFSTALLGHLAPLRYLSLGWYYLWAVLGG